MEQKAGYLVIGKVARPFGLKGEVKVFPITDLKDRYNYLYYVFVKSEKSEKSEKNGGKYHKVEIEDMRFSHDIVLLKFKGYDTKDSVKAFMGKLLFIDRDHAAPIAEGSYYYHDIYGCRVRTKDGIMLGRVSDIQNAGSCDIYVVQSEKKQDDFYYIPAISDVIKKIDIHAKEIEIEVIEGLF